MIEVKGYCVFYYVKQFWRVVVVSWNLHPPIVIEKMQYKTRTKCPFCLRMKWSTRQGSNVENEYHSAPVVQDSITIYFNFEKQFTHVKNKLLSLHVFWLSVFFCYRGLQIKQIYFLMYKFIKNIHGMILFKYLSSDAMKSSNNIVNYYRTFNVNLLMQYNLVPSIN